MTCPLNCKNPVCQCCPFAKDGDVPCDFTEPRHQGEGTHLKVGAALHGSRYPLSARQRSRRDKHHL